jgi:hypothetical protein
MTRIRPFTLSPTSFDAIESVRRRLEFARGGVGIVRVAAKFSMSIGRHRILV